MSWRKEESSPESRDLKKTFKKTREQVRSSLRALLQTTDPEPRKNSAKAREEQPSAGMRRRAAA